MTPFLTMVATAMLGTLGITLAAVVLAKIASVPIERVAESNQLSKTESESIFPRRLHFLFLAIYLPLTLGHTVAASSLPNPQWPLLLSFLVVCLVQAYRCRVIMNRQGRDSIIWRQAQLVFWLSVIGAMGCLCPLLLLPFLVVHP